MTSKPFPSWFAGLTRLSRRERLVIAGGAVVSAVALFVAFVIMPVARRWADREAAIGTQADRLARLESVITSREQIASVVEQMRRDRSQAARLLLPGETAAIAASNLQILLNRYADESRVLLEQVDVVGNGVAGDSLIPIPARIVARGDIYGLVDLLFYLQHGEKLIVIDEFRLDAGRGIPETRLVGWTATLHGYYAAPREGS